MGGEPRAPNCLSSPGHKNRTSPPSVAAGGEVGSPKARMRLSRQRSGESELGWAPGPSKNNPQLPTPRSGAFHTQAAVVGCPSGALLTPVRASLPRWEPERWAPEKHADTWEQDCPSHSLRPGVLHWGTLAQGTLAMSVDISDCHTGAGCGSAPYLRSGGDFHPKGSCLFQRSLSHLLISPVIHVTA